MLSASGRFTIIFNGEIYNFAELRRSLEALECAFRGHSDTEVLLAAFERWGPDETLPRLNGMFAVAVWDEQQRQLLLARDRLGEKPLYYGWHQGCFALASELKAIRSAFEGSFDINRSALAQMLRYNCVPAPHSIYHGIYKLPPGCRIRFDQEQLLGGSQPSTFSPYPDATTGLRPLPYWSLFEAAREASANPFKGDTEEASAELEKLLTNSIKLRMVADVPVGAFLSGGIDSSSVVALMQQNSTRRVKTYAIGFSEENYNEAAHAARVANHIGTDHETLLVTPQEAMRVVDELPRIYDEPFSDSSQIPTYLVSRMARKGVTVCLTGDGGDELFGGYDRYDWGVRADSLIRLCPLPIRRLLASAIRFPGAGLWDLLGKLLKVRQEERFGHRALRFADLLKCSGIKQIHRMLLTHWDDAEQVVIGAAPLEDVFTRAGQFPAELPAYRGMMLADLALNFTDDILVKVDRAAMAVSLETRIPLLDPAIIDFALSLPHTVLAGEHGRKAPLRALLYRHVPQELVNRPKMGFGVPLQRWLMTELRPWAEELLNERQLQQDGIFNAKIVRSRWNEFVTGRRAWDQCFWDILMFQAWHRSLGVNVTDSRLTIPEISQSAASQ